MPDTYIHVVVVLLLDGALHREYFLALYGRFMKLIS